MALILDGSLGITTPAETVTGNTILGDATTDTLTVGVTGIVKDASGNVGIGTSSPNTKLHVSADAAKIRIGLTADSAYLDISRDSATGFSIYNAAQATPFRAHIWQLGGTEAMRIDSSGNLLFNSGYGSAATAYGCRAWVNFNGTGTVAIRASGNVSSITDNGTGDYTVNFTTAMVDANYSANFSSNDSSTSGTNAPTGAGKRGTAQTTSAVGIYTKYNQDGGLADMNYVFVSVSR